MSITCLIVTGATTVFAQKKKLDRNLFAPASATPVNFRPFKATDFAKGSPTGNEVVTLPNKRTIKLADYVNAMNKVEGNLATIGFSRDRTQKIVVASKFKPASISGNAVVAANLNTQATLKPINAALNTRFTPELTMNKKIAGKIENKFTAARKLEIESLPNEKFDRTFNLTPPEFRKGDYGVKLVVSSYLKGENDPFFIQSSQMRQDSLTKLMRETTAFYTAGMKLDVSAAIPEIGTITAYKLESEFTARSNKNQKHSSKAKLQVLQTVLLNENKPAITGEGYTFEETRLYPVSKLIGGADIYTYGLNMLMPVDFYMTSIGVGAGLDVKMSRTGISGSIGPRFAQSIIMETSATEMLGPGGEALATIGDFGVGGEIRLVEAGVDFGFSAGMKIQNGRLVFSDDMAATAELEFLRGRIYTFYEYLNFKCDNIVLQGLNVACWETRRVENELFNSGSALQFSKTIVDEDKSVYVTW